MKSWRSVQLGNDNCDQDNIILGLYKNVPVKYIGPDLEFASKLVLDENSKHIVAIFNTANWLSTFIEFVLNLEHATSFYLGVNRYTIQGNDTNLTFDYSKPSGQTIIELVGKILPNFNIVKSGSFDNDQGRYFNFVQPLTWIYATNRSN